MGAAFDFGARLLNEVERLYVVAPAGGQGRRRPPSGLGGRSR
jgi:hypothetical protein